MALEVFKLFGSIFVNTDDAEKSIHKTDSSAKKVAQSLGNGIKTAAKWGTAVVGAAAGAGTAAMAAASNFAATTDKIDKSAQSAGFAADEYQKWDFILSQGGSSMSDMAAGIAKLTVNAQKGSNSATAAFEAIGLSIEEVQKMSEQDLFEATIKGLHGVEDTAQRTQIATDLFGKASATKLAATLNTSTEAIENMKDMAVDLGMVISDESIAAGVHFTDLTDQLKRSFSGLKSNLMTNAMPAINKVLEYIIDKMPEINKMIKKIGDILPDFFDSLLSPLLELGEQLLPLLFDTLESLLPVFGDIVKTVLPVISELLQTLMPIFVKIVEKLLPPLMKILDALLPVLDIVMQAIEPILKVLLLILDPLGKLLDAIAPIITVLLELAQNVLEPLMPIIEAVAELLTGVLGVAFSVAIDLINSTVIPAFEGLNAFLEGDFSTGFMKIGEAIQGGFESMLNGIDSLLGTHLSEWYAEVKQACFDFGTWLADAVTDQDEINDLATKYDGSFNSMLGKYSAYVKGGLDSKTALNKAYTDVYTNDEMALLFSRQEANALTTMDAFKGLTKDEIVQIATGGAIPHYATGGLAYADTLAVIGDNADAAVNPEVVAPLKDLTAIITDSIVPAIESAVDRVISRAESTAAAVGQPVTIIVQLQSGLELARTVIKDIKTISRIEGGVVIG